MAWDPAVHLAGLVKVVGPDGTVWWVKPDVGSVDWYKTHGTKGTGPGTLKQK
jgi:hypothetical protein